MRWIEDCIPENRKFIENEGENKNSMKKLFLLFRNKEKRVQGATRLLYDNPPSIPPSVECRKASFFRLFVTALEFPVKLRRQKQPQSGSQESFDANNGHPQLSLADGLWVPLGKITAASVRRTSVDAER